MITRRVTQRQFLLLPSKIINQIILYSLAVAAKKTGVTVHAVCALSNHIHVIATDPSARLPLFSYILFKYIAKCVNAHRGRWENLWAGGVQPSYVRLGDANAMLDKMAYVVTNPVEAGLVRSSEKWPGVLLWRPGSYTARRPKVFFREGGPMPKEVALSIRPVPLSDGLTEGEMMGRIASEIEAREREHQAKHKAKGRTYLGVAGILAQKETDAPRTHEPRRGLSPRIASRDKWRRIELLQRLKAFWQDYKHALLAWCTGDRGVVFPAGVYKMRVQFGVSCAEH